MRILISQSFLTKRVFGFVFLAAMTAGVSSLSLKAQDPMPTSPTTATKAEPAKTESAKPEEAKNSQEEQEKALRLEGPIVKATAKALNISQDSAATLFEFINFGVLFLLVGIPLVKVMPKIFRQRGQNLQHSLEEARKATTEAQARLSAIEAKLAGLDTEIAEIRTQVEADSVQDEVRIKASIEEEKVRVVASAEQEISVASVHARRQLQHFAADLAIEQAAKQLVLTPEADQALIAEFIKGAAQGGQN